jgi:hypothetical protein
VIGPLIHMKAVEKIEAHIADAVKKGTKVVLGGKPKYGIEEFLQASSKRAGQDRTGEQIDNRSGQRTPANFRCSQRRGWHIVVTRRPMRKRIIGPRQIHPLREESGNAANPVHQCSHF